MRPTWRPGKQPDTVVSDWPGNSPTKDDISFHDFYGGYLVAESIAPENVPVIAAAPEMYELLKRYIADDPCAPGDARFIEEKEIIASIERKTA